MIEESKPRRDSKRTISSGDIRRNFKGNKGGTSGFSRIILVLIILMIFGGTIWLINSLSDRPRNPFGDTKNQVESTSNADAPADADTIDNKKPAPPLFNYKGYNSYSYQGNQYAVFTIEMNNRLADHFSFEKTSGNQAANSFVSFNRKKFSDEIPSEPVFKDPSDFFVITGAMYESSDKLPPGLLISQGKRLKALNTTTNATGNFFVLPNGVFYLMGNEAKIVETSAFDDSRNYSFAIQSGPMLVMNKNVSSSLDPFSPHKNKRCAVGIRSTRSGEEIVFVCSRNDVTFHELATFMSDKFSCRSALHLESGVFPFISWPGCNYRNSNKVMNYIMIR